MNNRLLRYGGTGVVLLLAAIGLVSLVLLAVDRDPADAGGDGGRPLDLAARGVYDSFVRGESGSLGDADSGASWTEVTGDWGISDHHASLREPYADGAAVAVIDARASDGVVQATLTEVARGAGVVFRYENPFNYWSLTAAPPSATWVVSKMVEGTLTDVGPVGTSPVGDGTTVAVRFDGARLRFLVDGVEREAIRDRDLQGATQVGIIARGGDAHQARWANFVAVAEDSP